MSSPTKKPPKKPKKKKFNANGATVKWLEALGWTPEIVEHRIPHTFISRDLFGVIDILAMPPSCSCIAGFQATANSTVKGKSIRSNELDRRRKLLASEKAKMFVKCGGSLSLVVWSEGEPGEWKPTFTSITLGDFS